jgi:hypothetical protein
VDLKILESEADSGCVREIFLGNFMEGYSKETVEPHIAAYGRWHKTHSLRTSYSIVETTLMESSEPERT